MPRSLTNTTGPTLGQPRWAGDYRSRDHLIPGPFHLVPADFDPDFVDVTTGKIVLPSGTIVGRTLVERAAGTGFGVPDDADDELFIIAFDVLDAEEVSDCEMYRPGSQVFENFLPDFAGQSAAVKAAIRAQYLCTLGQV